MTDTPIIVLRALAHGYRVQIEGLDYAYDPEVQRIGVMRKHGNEEFCAYCDEIGVNRFLSMCSQVSDEYAQQIQQALVMEEMSQGGTQ